MECVDDGSRSRGVVGTATGQQGLLEGPQAVGRRVLEEALERGPDGVGLIHDAYHRAPRAVRRLPAAPQAGATAYSRRSSSMPFRACIPRSMKVKPEPATRSRTDDETSTSPAPAVAATLAPVWTAIPRTSPLG